MDHYALVSAVCSVIYSMLGDKDICPELDKKHSVITDDNLHSLYLSTYERYEGTRVSITCLVPSFALVGSSVLRCMADGKWDQETPRCYPKGLTRTTPPVIFSRTVTKQTAVGQVGDSLSPEGVTTPYVITVCILAAMFLCLVLVLLYLIRLKKEIDRRLYEIDNRPPFVRAVDSLRSLPSISSGPYDYYRRPHSPISLTSSNYSRSQNKASTSSSDSSRYMRPPPWKGRERSPLHMTYFTGR